MSTDKLFSIFFTTAEQLRNESSPKLPTIYFSPIEEGWNDFTFRTRFNYKVTGFENKSDYHGTLHLAFADSDEDPGKKVRLALQQEETRVINAESFPEFFTLQFDMDAYRKFVRFFGPKSTEILLNAINDLVAIKRGNTKQHLVTLASKRQPFTLGFMRNAETFFAFHNASPILDGLDQELLRGISEELKLEFKLDTFENPHVFDFKFSALGAFPKRIAVVIGENGIGKSQSLANCAKSLLKGDNRLLGGSGSPPIINRLLAFSSPGETRNTFPSPRKNIRIQYHHIVLSKSPFANRKSGLGDALVRLARSTETIKEKSRWDLFCEAIQSIVPIKELAIKPKKEKNPSDAVNQPDHSNIHLEHMLIGGEQQRLTRWGKIEAQADVFRIIKDDLIPLSSGQLTFIRFLAHVCLHIENGTLLLFDEPETHLHPNYISDFIRLLDGLLEKTGSIAILATHSAYFIREVPRSQVFVLKRTQDHRIEINNPRLKTLGADIGEISHYVFGDTHFGSLLGQIRKQLHENPADGSALIQSLENEVSTEALMSLRREIAPDSD